MIAENEAEPEATEFTPEQTVILALFRESVRQLSSCGNHGIFSVLELQEILKIIDGLTARLAAKDERIAELEKRPDFNNPGCDVSDLYPDDETEAKAEPKRFVFHESPCSFVLWIDYVALKKKIDNLTADNKVLREMLADVAGYAGQRLDPKKLRELCQKAIEALGKNQQGRIDHGYTRKHYFSIHAQ